MGAAQKLVSKNKESHHFSSIDEVLGVVENAPVNLMMCNKNYHITYLNSKSLPLSPPSKNILLILASPCFAKSSKKGKWASTLGIAAAFFVSSVFVPPKVLLTIGLVELEVLIFIWTRPTKKEESSFHEWKQAS